MESLAVLHWLKLSKTPSSPPFGFCHAFPNLPVSSLPPSSALRQPPASPQPSVGVIQDTDSLQKCDLCPDPPHTTGA